MKYINIFFVLVVLFFASCSSQTAGELDRATTVSNTSITYIIEHPEEFGKDKEVTVKGKVKSSQKLPLLGSTVVLQDDKGNEIVINLADGSNVPAKDTEFVVTGFIEQGLKFEIANYQHNGIVLKQKTGE